MARPGDTQNLTLPDAASAIWYAPGAGGAAGKSKRLEIHRPLSDGGGTLTVAGKTVNGTQQLINGATSTTLIAGQILYLRSFGTGWYATKELASNAQN